MGQLMLAGCYDNVSRIIIYSTINFSSIKMLLCRSGWRKAGPDRERISSALSSQVSAYIESVVLENIASHRTHWGDSYARQVGRLWRNIIRPVGSLQ